MDKSCGTLLRDQILLHLRYESRQYSLQSQIADSFQRVSINPAKKANDDTGDFGDFQSSPASSPRGSSDNIFASVKMPAGKPAVSGNKNAVEDLLSLDSLFPTSSSTTASSSVTKDTHSSRQASNGNGLFSVPAATTAKNTGFKADFSKMNTSTIGQNASGATTASAVSNSFTADFKSLSLSGVFSSAENEPPSAVTDPAPPRESSAAYTMEQLEKQSETVGVPASARSMDTIDLFADFTSAPSKSSSSSNQVVDDLFSMDFVPVDTTTPPAPAPVKPVVNSSIQLGKLTAPLDIFASSAPAVSPAQKKKSVGIKDLAQLDFGNPVISAAPPPDTKSPSTSMFLFLARC